MAADIGIDLGTASVLVYVKGKGVILKEPSVVAYDRDSNSVKAIGEEARSILGRSPGNVIAIRPLRHGVISDYSVTETMLKYFVQKAVGRHNFLRPLVNICIPTGCTEVEQKAVEEAAFVAGARDVTLVEEPIAAAIGVGVDITKPVGSMIVDIGGGTTDIAVISLGGMVLDQSLKIAGDDFNEALVKYIRNRHGMLIGERIAEDIKIRIGTVYQMMENDSIEVKGRDLTTGMPKTVSISSVETEEALKDTVNQILDGIVNVLSKTPPELAADILDRGIILTGGGAKLRGLEEIIEERTGVKTMLADNPEMAVAIGTGVYEPLNNLMDSENKLTGEN